MKVGLIIERMDPSRGGRETSTAQIAEALAARGQAVTIICQESGWQSQTPGVKIQPSGSRGPRRFVADVQHACQPGRFDVTHAMLPIPGADIYQPRGGTVPAQVAAGLRCIDNPLKRFTARLGRRLNLRRRYWASLEKQVAADTSAICLAGSEMVAREFATYYRRSENVRVVFNGVDKPMPPAGETRAASRARIRRQLALADDEPVFLTIATNFKLKGVDLAIAALAKMRSQFGRGTLVAVGQGSPGRFGKLARSLGVAEAVRFVPRTASIFPWYAAADACVLLSWYDACSRVVLEACRLGIPSITTASNGASEALATGGGIVVASPADTSAVAEAMLELAEAKNRRNRAEACLAGADRLGIARHVDELLGIYSQIAEKK